MDAFVVTKNTLFGDLEPAKVGPITVVFLNRVHRM